MVSLRFGEIIEDFGPSGADVSVRNLKGSASERVLLAEGSETSNVVSRLDAVWLLKSCLTTMKSSLNRVEEMAILDRANDPKDGKDPTESNILGHQCQVS